MIGSNLVRRLRALDADVTVVDNLWRGSLDNLCDAGTPVIDLEKDFHQLDLAVPGVLDSLLPDVDIVFHLADVVAGIGYVFNNQGSIFRQNVLINSNVISAVRERPVAGFRLRRDGLQLPGAPADRPRSAAADRGRSLSGEPGVRLRLEQADGAVRSRAARAGGRSPRLRARPAQRLRRTDRLHR